MLTRNNYFFYYFRKQKEIENQVIPTQIFENQNLQRRDRSSRSKSRHHQVEAEAANRVTDFINDSNQTAPLTSNWQHQLDMMSLSKHQNFEPTVNFQFQRSGVDQRIFNNLHKLDDESYQNDEIKNEMGSSSIDPFLSSKGKKNNEGDCSSQLETNQNGSSIQNTSKKTSLWTKGLPVLEQGSEPSSIELLAQDMDQDGYSSSESIDTNSFSSYIPGPSLDQGTFAAFTELVEQEIDDEKDKMIPLMKKTSSQGLVLAAKQSPKIWYVTQFSLTFSKDLNFHIF